MKAQAITMKPTLGGNNPTSGLFASAEPVGKVWVQRINRWVSLRLVAGIALGILFFAAAGYGQQSSNASSANVNNAETGTDANSSVQLADSPADQDNIEPIGGAHCFCKAGVSIGNYVKDFGAIWHYGINNKKNRTDCSNRCWDYMENWGLKNQSNRPEVCTDFYKEGGANLGAYWAVGTDGYAGPSYTLHPSDIGYPLSCGVSSGILPRYYVLDLIYSPPGCTPDTKTTTGYGCKPGSVVMYGTSSSTGTTLSMQNTIKDDITVTASLGSKKVDDITPFGISIKGGFSGSSVSGDSETITKTASSTLTWPAGGGPISGDGITHEQDEFVLLLNPGAIYANWQDPSTSHQYVAWTMGYRGDTPVTQPVSVTWLRCALIATGNYDQVRIYSGGKEVPCDPMPANLQNNLQNNYHLTFDDFFNVLQLDPYWHSASNPITIDKTRFVAEPFDFPYLQPVKNIAPLDWNCLGKSNSISNSFTGEITSGQTREYSVDYSVDFGLPKFFKVGEENKMTFTNTVSTKNTQTDTQTASASVYCSSLDWGAVPSNPTRTNVYFDAFFGSFLFELSDFPADKMLISSGQIQDASGHPVRAAKLELLYNGQKYHSFSDNDGNYKFSAVAGSEQPFTAVLSVVGSSNTVTETVTVGATTTILLPESFGQQR